MKNDEALSIKIVDCITEYIHERWEEDKLDEKCLNSLLREDVLPLLDKYCTVVYFPLNGEKNNGFHITDIPDKSGRPTEFVFINTAQTMEKQVFTAAHELGHIWNVDKVVADKLGIDVDGEMQERIINRFAAELLMPKKQFDMAFSREYAQMIKDSDKISVDKMLYLIAALMNEFFVPYKSVVWRLHETSKIPSTTMKLMLGDTLISYEDIRERILEIINESNYFKLMQISKRKWIDGFAELLDNAEQEDIVSKSKITAMRKKFGIAEVSPNAAFDRRLMLEGDDGAEHEN